MFIVTAKFSRRRVLAAVAVLLLVLALTVLPRACRKADEAPSIPAETNEQRVAYLVFLGWKVNEQPIETLSVTLGDALEEPYESYNALQLEQGFDLSRCCGKTLLRYTYVVTNYPGASLPCQADLYVCDGVVAAGDIVCTGENGFMAPLAFPAA